MSYIEEHVIPEIYLELVSVASEFAPVLAEIMGWVSEEDRQRVAVRGAKARQLRIMNKDERATRA